MTEAGVAALAVGMLILIWARAPARTVTSVPPLRVPRYWFHVAGRSIPVYVRGRWYESSVDDYWDVGADTLPRLRDRVRWCAEALRWISDGTEIRVTQSPSNADTIS